MDNRSEVRDFLTTRRARPTPEQVGLPPTRSPRVPGLRRSEVAALAGLSVEYYARLERGQIADASSGVLEALTWALQLDETERAHLYDLARVADGIPTSGRPRRRTTTKAASRLSLRWALEAITDGVAFVRDPQQNLLATNALGRAFYAPVIGDGGRLPNLARFQFLGPASRDFYPDWNRFAEVCVGVMRAEAGRDPHDRGLQDLVGELSTRSETFRRRWATTTSAPRAPAPRGSTTRSSATSPSPTRSSPSPRSPASCSSSTRPNRGLRLPSGSGCWPRGRRPARRRPLADARRRRRVRRRSGRRRLRLRWDRVPRDEGDRRRPGSPRRVRRCRGA
jgi:transcriptional regulator with XRE-family HTH domain